MKKSKYLIIIVALFFIIFGYSCKKKQHDVPKIIEQLGSITGGTINLNEVKIEFSGSQIPIDGKALLTEISNDNIDEINNNIVTKLYSLEINESFDSTIKITLPIDDSKLKDGSVIKLGIGQDYLLGSNNKERIYKYIDVTISDDVASTSFIPSEYINIDTYLGSNDEATTTQTSNKAILYLGFFSQNATYLVENGHFKIWFPSGLNFSEQHRNEVLNDLETMLSMYQNIGYDCGNSFPFEFSLQRNLKNVGYYDWLTNELVIRANELDETDFSSSYKSLILPTIYHEFFHYIQDNYVDYAFINMWFIEATASYYEAKLNNSTVTGPTQENYELMFYSVIPEKSNANNGYARAPLIAYMCQQKGNDNWIKEIYESKDDSNNNIKKVMNDISSTFESDYYLALAKGDTGNRIAQINYSTIIKQKEIVNQMGAKLSLKVPSESDMKEILNQGEAVILDRVGFDLKATGGKYVALEISSTELAKIPDDATISIHCEDGVMNLLKIKNKECGLTSFDIENFKQNINDGWNYMAVIQSPLKQKVYVTVELSTETPAIYNQVKVSPDYADSGKGLLRYALYSLNTVIVDKEGNFTFATSEFSYDDKIITNLTLKGKIDFKTLTVNATLSYATKSYIIKDSEIIGWNSSTLVFDNKICDEVYTISTINGKLLRTSYKNETRDPIIDPESEDIENCYTFYWSDYGMNKYYHAPEIYAMYNEEEDYFYDPNTKIKMDSEHQAESEWFTVETTPDGILSDNISIELCFYWID